MNKIHKLYLFEGLNEHGITSLASDIKEQLEKEGRIVKHYQEGMSHPADMALHAYLSMDEYKEFLQDVLAIWNYDKCCTKEELMECILKETHFEEDHAIIAYRQIAFPNADYESLLADLAAREVYDGKLSYPEFKSLHLRRWKRFCKEALNTPNTVFLFENSIFKNHIHELMGFYDMADDMILDHLTLLIRQVLPLNPVVYYICPEAPCHYSSSLYNRLDSSSETLAAYVKTSNYGKLHGLDGKKGVCKFLANRFRIEQLALDAFSTLPELTIYCWENDQLSLRHPSR